MRWRRPAGPQILRAFADAYPRAVFVEIGANDGVRTDYLRPFIVSCDWRGVMVEPVPWLCGQLRDNYRGQEGVAFENAAISETDGQVPFYYVPPAKGRGQGDGTIWSDAIGSLSRAEVEESIAVGRAVAVNFLGVEIPHDETRIETIEVASLTFESLCRKHGIEALDLVLIDAEGYDYEIVKRIDFGRHRPRLLIYESTHLSGDERDKCQAYVQALGYETIDEGYDTWCHDPRADDTLARRWRSARRWARIDGFLHRIRRTPRGPHPAGWYPDPDHPGVHRYWDGTKWSYSTPHRLRTSLRSWFARS